MQEIGWGVSGSCQELSDWLQMEEVTLRDPGSGHRGHCCLTSTAVFHHRRPLSGVLSFFFFHLTLSLFLLRPSPVIHHVCFNSWAVTHAEKLWAHRRTKALISGLKGDQSWTAVSCLINNLQLFSLRLLSLSTNYNTCFFFSFLYAPSPANLLPCVSTQLSDSLFHIWNINALLFN